MKHERGIQPLNDTDVVGHAQEWARLHANPKTRSQMDKVLDNLSPTDQRRVYLCGQRIAGGLSAKVLAAPASNKQEASDGKPTKKQTKATSKPTGKRPR